MKFNVKPWILLTILFLGLMTVCLNGNTVKATEMVSGILTTDTIWTKSNSPYNLTGNLLVSNGITLTIQPGVTVNLNGFYIMVNGTLNARGTSTEWITLDNGYSITFTDFCSDWNTQTDSGCIIEYANMTIPQSVYIQNSSPKIANCIADTTIIVSLGTPLISNNQITGHSNGGAVIVYGGSPLILNNTLKNRELSFIHYGVSFSGPNSAYVAGNIINRFRSAGIGMMPGPSYNNEGMPIIEKNNITNSPVGIDIRINAIIRNNTISGNIVGILDPSTASTIAYNNFGNTQYDIKLEDVTGNVGASNNWWGTTNSTLISQKIYDYNDDFKVGLVTFNPYLNELNFGAWSIDTNPPAPTQSVSTTSSAPTTTEPSTIPEFVNPTIIVTTMAVIALMLILTVRLKKPKPIKNFLF